MKVQLIEFDGALDVLETRLVQRVERMKREGIKPVRTSQQLLDVQREKIRRMKREAK